MEILVTIDQFDGPLNLLLYLVEKNQLNLRSLNITQLTKLYLEYLNKMKELNFDLLGDFLFMASNLVYLRSEYQEKKEKESHPDSDDLIKQLLELKNYQRLGNQLWNLDKNFYEHFLHSPLATKKKDLLFLRENFSDMDQLIESYKAFKLKQKRVIHYVQLDEQSLEDSSKEIVNILQTKKECYFSEFSSRFIVIHFMAVLELSKLKILQLYQTEDHPLKVQLL